MKASLFNTVLPAFVLSLLFLVGGYYTNDSNYERMMTQSRNDVLQDVVTLKSKLESEIISNTHLINGLAAVIKENPDIDQETYGFYGGELIKLEPSIKNLALAQDYVVRQTYPVEGNENVIGVDYRDIPDQKASAERVEQLEEIVISGPHNLVQGWKGVIGRVPIFDMNNNFWGFITAVIKLDDLMAEVGIGEYEGRLNIALETSAGSTPEPEIFYGDEALFNDDSIIVEVNLSNGLWRIAAQPIDGWPRFAPNRGIVMISSIIAAITTIVLGFLIFKYFKYTEETTQRLSNAFRQAEHSSRVKNKFLASVSHELRTPLNAIVGFTEVIETGVHGPLGDEKYNEYVRHIGNSGKHLTAIIDDILDLARIDAGDYKLNMEQVGVVEQLNKAIEIVQSQADKKTISFKVKSPEREVYILADKLRIRQIMINILLNAIQQSPYEKEILILVINGGRNAFVSVKDQGDGMDEEEIKSLLEPFGTNAELTDVGFSNGLGLPVSVEFARLMKGNIEFEADKGAGTKVTLMIPLA